MLRRRVTKHQFHGSTFLNIGTDNCTGCPAHDITWPTMCSTYTLLSTGLQVSDSIRLIELQLQLTTYSKVVQTEL